MKSIRDLGKYAIPFYFNDRSIVLKVTKYTTCDDVIEMILRKENLSTSGSSYSMLEKTSKLERCLPGRSLVVKIWRSWGCESSNFRFVIRPKHAASNIGLRLKQFSAEAEIDALFVDKYRTNLWKNGSQRKSSAAKMAVKEMTPETRSYADADDSCTSLVSRSPATPRNIKCASFLLSKFFNDLLQNTKRTDKYRISNRKRGDGAEMPTARSRHGDGAEDADFTLSTSLARCQYVWDSNNMSDTDSDLSDEFSLDDDRISFGEETFHSNEGQLDTAFVGTVHDSDSDEGIDVTSVTSFDLDTAFVGDFELTSEKGSRISVNKFEANISNDDFVKELFGCHGDECEDDEMDSFMRSRLDSF